MDCALERMVACLRSNVCPDCPARKKFPCLWGFGCINRVTTASARPDCQINVNGQSIGFDVWAQRRASRQQNAAIQPETYQWIGQNMESRSCIRMNLI